MSYKLPTTAVITDAGCASRFLPITKAVPKAMLPMGNRPIMELIVEECLEAGIEEIIIVTSPEGRDIYEDYFFGKAFRIEQQLASQGKESRFEPVQHVLDVASKVRVIEQGQELPYGNGSPIASAKPYIPEGEAFIAIYSDDVVFGTSDVKTLIESYKEHPDAKAIIIAQEMPREVLNKFGIIRLADEAKMTLQNIVEKPAIEDAPSNLTSYGRYLLTPDVFRHLDPKNIGLDDELWTVDAITKLTEEGDVIVEKTRGHWMTTGDPKNYMMALLQYTLENEDFADDVRAFIK